MKQRIKALKKIQLDFTNMEADFYKEVHALEVSACKKNELIFPENLF